MRQFKTESKKLLDLMINSIYTNREIFLRELISNASDAIDKLWFRSLTDQQVSVDRGTLAIRVSFDKDARTITVSDNGLGMTSEQLDKNLGTIAHSDSEEFKRVNEQDKDSGVDIIGQFGVGFYSAFMVGCKVRVVSRAYGADQAFAWESDGVSGYTVAPAGPGERDGADDHGTDVTVTLRPSTEQEDTDRLLSEWALKDLVRRYSNYVRYPIQMMVGKRRPLPRPDDAPDDYKTQYEDYQELETINSMKPIWLKRQGEVEQSDYDEFYKSTFHDFQPPARTLSFHAEGALSYDVLLFIPSRPPFDMYSSEFKKGLALYSSSVMIQEKCEDLLPDYLAFVRGVVDSPDITLNISRETLQQNAQLRMIARHVERKVLAELRAWMGQDRAGYKKFFEDFGRALKFGIYQSYGQKASQLADLLLFWSAEKDAPVTLREYVDAMPSDQDRIYYAAGDSRERLGKMPVVESARAHGRDVLLCTADVDDFMFQAMGGYHIDAVAPVPETEDADGNTVPATPGSDARDIQLVNVGSAGLDFATQEERDRADKASEENKDLFDALKEALGEKVDAVRAAADMGDSPARVSAQGEVSLEMERLMQEGPGADQAPKASRVLEVNVAHPVFEKLRAAQAGGDTDKLALYAGILYDQALLVVGVPVDDPVEFARRVCSLM